MIRAGALAALSLAAAAALAQPQAGYFKGKVKPGQYEITTVMEAPGYESDSKARRRCISAQDIGNDAEEAGCEARDFKGAGNSATWSVVCTGKDPKRADTKVAVTPEGFTSETVVTGTEGGKPYRLTQTTRGRYLRPCPQ